jgi:hypothetical protein
MPTPRLSNRNFGLMFATVFMVVFSVAWFVFQTWFDWALIVAGSLLAIALVCPITLLPLNRLWGCIAHGIGVFNNYFLLGLFYFLILAPLGIVMRLAGRDPLCQKLGPTIGDYWMTPARKPDAPTFKDLF